MDELIARITQSTGLDADKAKEAVGHVFAFLHNEGPAHAVSEVLAKVPGAAELAAAAPEAGNPSSGGGLMGMLGSLTGNSGGLMGLAGKLTAAGLDMGQMQTVGKEVFALAREKAGEDVVGEIAGAIPGLSQFT